MDMESFIGIALVVLCLVVFIFVVEIPYKIARSRKASADVLFWIRVLCWLGIFFGLTWIVALIWALIAEKDATPSQEASRSLDSLEKLKALYDAGAITQNEYEEKKRILLDRLS